jgi:hypothetical protein
MALPLRATVPTHYLELTFGFVGGHITQGLPTAGILGTRRLLRGRRVRLRPPTREGVAQAPRRGMG